MPYLNLTKADVDGMDDETANALGMSARTVRREWAFARAFLFRALSG